MGRPGLSHHPKFLQLARALGEVVARGVLELMWEVSYESGDERLGSSPDAVEAAARWRGERGLCFAALRDSTGQGTVGFIEDRAGVWCVHDLWDHAPDYVRKRAVREEQRRTKGRSMAAERRTVTGQAPVSVQALTPPPAPTRAPSPAPEKKKPAGSAPADPPRVGWQALIDRLTATYTRLMPGAPKYAFDGRDAKALKSMLDRGVAPAAIEAAWERALAHQGFPTVRSLPELDQHLNHFLGAAKALRGGAPKETAAEIEEANRRQEEWVNGG